VTAKQLRDAGIAVSSAGVQRLTNSCAVTGNSELSISDDMLSAFKARGFSLESVCLGLISSFNFDPDTGRAVPFAVLGKGEPLPLNLPDCFKRGLPLLDCKWTYYHDVGVKAQEGEHEANRKVGTEIDAIAVARMRRAGPNGVEYPYDNCSRGNTSFKKHCILLHRVAFSPGLPRGYGYALQHPEGADPEQDTTNLATSSRKIGTLPLWSDKQE
jgi:hypothetical protein